MFKLKFFNIDILHYLANNETFVLLANFLGQINSQYNTIYLPRLTRTGQSISWSKMTNVLGMLESASGTAGAFFETL